MRTSALLLAVILTAACSGSDPGGGEPETTGDAGPAKSTKGTGSGGSSTADAGPQGITQPPDDPGVYVPDPVDAFTGDPGYKSDPPAMRANAMHASGNITGQPCLTCHDGVTCVKFDFGGTVWRSPALTQTVADVEVRLIDATNHAYTVHSDADGNFWHFASKDLALPAHSGVRTANFHAIGTLNGANCNECHNENRSTPGRLFVK